MPGSIKSWERKGNQVWVLTTSPSSALSGHGKYRSHPNLYDMTGVCFWVQSEQEKRSVNKKKMVEKSELYSKLQNIIHLKSTVYYKRTWNSSQLGGNPRVPTLHVRLSNLSTLSDTSDGPSLRKLLNMWANFWRWKKKWHGHSHISSFVSVIYVTIIWSWLWSYFIYSGCIAVM